ncbi:MULTISPECIES: sigma factor-like helix-turn-helix DNA-binding protein [Pseudomonas]|jgi:RNA polymerase sigma-70 factor (ECF subfamily)|uniref:sigma factor-like helix-turn-helix DNA-binding protein n=1 Tax=Pseudomonas TaxID=286 RepID=UPI001C81592A|nr:MULTISPECIES: sigma factor-like helix-turn-helix DNA-binding protein [Pseudomonas]MDH0897049.1 ECF-type sigma factor [Pseudomonas sp. GD03875]MDH1066358.1 ECF-type sigma factor [Pseudomonas sp. GD03985]
MNTSSPFPSHPLRELHPIQELELLSRRLRGLPRRSQQVFLLSRLDGLSYENIAERLGISMDLVEKNMLRVLRQCQRSGTRG